MKTITSRQNAEIKKILELHTSKGRKHDKKFIAEGLRVIQTFLEHKYSLYTFYVTSDQLAQALALASQDTITVVSNEVMQKISTATTPSGLLAVFAIPDQPAWKQLSAGVVLAQISDPGNMGTLMRTTAAMGFKTVVVIEGTDPWSPKVIQASAGTLASLNIFQCSWSELISQKKDLSLCALVVSGGKTPEQILNKQSLLVVGNEAQGLPREWISQCDERLTIPMPGNTESLNAAIAGSIALYLMIKK
jgi:TrmH family RNA methyltransferase